MYIGLLYNMIFHNAVSSMR